MPGKPFGVSLRRGECCVRFSLRCWVRVRRQGFPLRFDGLASRDARAGPRCVIAPVAGGSGAVCGSFWQKGGARGCR